jgi:DNA-binding LacI/PurR family transcriptional regulator
MARGTKLSDVAEAAGVSLGTASNVFNHPDLVRAEVREAVHAAAQRLGYKGPDAVGRLLMGGKANVIGVLPPGDMPVATAFRSPFFREFVLGVAEICDERSASLVVLPGSADRKAWAIRNALVDGFILGHRDDVKLVSARRRKVPCVVMDMDAGPKQSTVRIEAAAGAKLAAQHLLGLGHRDFAIVSVLREPKPPIVHVNGISPARLSGGFPIDDEKLDGFREALSEAGIRIEDVPIVEGYPHPPWSALAAQAVFDAAPAATALFAMSDRNAVAVMEEAKRRNISVPDQLSVVGFDDAPNAATSRPPLTTIAQPIVKKGRIAAEILFERGAVRHEILPVELIVRASTSRRLH